MKLEEITSKYEHPIIGIIGATSPLPYYNAQEARKLGYWLRDCVEKKGGVFTGGVSGVGVDVYRGVVDYCLERRASDKFFLLLPDMELEPPQEYLRLAEQTKDGILKVERVGRDMEERRSYVGALADLLVVVNGSRGTIDEALKGLLLGKQLLCLQNSGGAAEVISKLKRGEIEGIPLDVDLELIKTFDSVEGIVDCILNSKFYKFSNRRHKNDRY